MEPLPPSLLPLLTAAADLRAAGSSWAKVADKVGRDAETCRHWPRRYPETWRRLYREAEGQFIAEAGVEARTYLRSLLRHQDPKIVLGAARLLQSDRTLQRDREDQETRLTPAKVATEITEFVHYLKGLTDEQVTAHLDDFQAHRRSATDSIEPPRVLPLQANFQISIADILPTRDEFGQRLAEETQSVDDMVLVPQPATVQPMLLVAVVAGQSPAFPTAAADPVPPRDGEPEQTALASADNEQQADRNRTAFQGFDRSGFRPGPTAALDLGGPVFTQKRNRASNSCEDLDSS